MFATALKAERFGRGVGRRDAMTVCLRGLLVAGLSFATMLGAPVFAARAQTFDITYSGSDVSGGFTNGASGSGSFTLDAFGNLTAFTFTLDQYTTYNNTPETDVFTYGISDVAGLNGSFFNAIVSGGQLISLNLLTDEQPGYYTPDTAFGVMDLGQGDAFTVDFEDVGTLTSGTVFVTPVGGPVPEPGTLTVLGIGMAGVVAARRLRAARA
jgi:hypothetical protein